MKILIAGSQGMLGSDLVECLNAGHQVLGLGRAQLDITNPDQCQRAVAEFKPGAVINAAAMTNVDYCESHEEECFRVNAQGTANLATAAAAAGSVFVHYSSDYVFDGTKTEPYREEDATNPLSVYGRSKLQGEELARSHCPSHLILRTSWVFGRNGKNFIRTIVGAAREGRPLRVVHDQRGSPSYTRDLAEHTRIMLEAGSLGTYHLTNSGACSWYELARLAIKYANLDQIEVSPVTTAEFPRPAPRPANSVLSNARLASKGFPLMRPWQEAAEEYVRTFLHE
jgi:dTDP-4-dehydrorhamnose reductase